MSKFDELDSYIMPFSDAEQGDFWYDFAAEHARKLLGQFNADDYKQLQDTIRYKSDEWIIRVCETIDDAQPNQIIDILISLLEHENSRVVLASLDSIRGVIQNGLDCISDTSKIEKAIDRVLPKSGSIWGIAIADLQRLLKGKPQRDNWKQ